MWHSTIAKYSPHIHHILVDWCMYNNETCKMSCLIESWGTEIIIIFTSSAYDYHVYGKNKNKSITGFKNSTRAAPKITCQSNRTWRIFITSNRCIYYKKKTIIKTKVIYSFSFVYVTGSRDFVVPLEDVSHCPASLSHQPRHRKGNTLIWFYLKSKNSYNIVSS